ncbi:APC family permease [Patulibacter sp.]|uniref:APC family permease n=1 Tax=Patulibacter sp. TaxID=1912859 RepID=UPI00271855F2|nr:APC family permease [Patulibacter sp.]MDO9407364.1 APC family permease [Patulibacter sp.]
MTTEAAPRPVPTGPAGPAGPELRPGTLGFVEVLFQALASAGPGLGVTLAVIVGAGFAGGALSLSIVLATVGILLVGTTIGQMAKHFPSAGGFYTYVSNGLHPAVGTMVAWLYLSIWLVFPSTLFLPFGHFVSTTLHDLIGTPVTGGWIVAALLCLALVYRVGRSGASVSTTVGVVLGAVEFLVLGVLAVWLVVKAGDGNTLSVFTTDHTNVEGFAGTSGIVGGMVFAIFAFVGFENVVPMAEEAKDPRRSVARVAVLAPLILGGFILFCTYAATAYFGAARFDEFPASNGGDAWIGLAKDVWHGGWYVLLVMILNSCVASANGATNAGTRHIFAMARIELLPKVFARVDPVTGTPTVALGALMGLSAVVTVVVGLAVGTPLGGFAFLGTIESAMAILLYMLVGLACLVFFVRTRPAGFNPLLHVLVPVLAILVMIPVLMAAVGIGSGIFKFVSPLPHPLEIAGYLTLGWVVAGVVYTAYQWRVHPDRVRATEHVFVDDPA